MGGFELVGFFLILNHCFFFSVNKSLVISLVGFPCISGFRSTSCVWRFFSLSVQLKRAKKCEGLH